MKTFFIEDNVVIRQNLVETLEEMTDVQSMGFADGEAAARQWLMAAGGSWELAVVDIFLADGNGLGVLASMAQREPHQKVVVLSNYATQDIRQRCSLLGADRVFDKSNELDALFDYCWLLSASH